MIYLSEVFNPNKKKLIADFFLVGHLHLVDYVQSTARRPHNSPAHTVKDQSLATSSEITL